ELMYQGVLIIAVPLDDPDKLICQARIIEEQPCQSPSTFLIRHHALGLSSAFPPLSATAIFLFPSSRKEADTMGIDGTRCIGPAGPQHWRQLQLHRKNE